MKSKDIFSHSIKGRYGVRRVYQELIKRGHKVNHKAGTTAYAHYGGWQESAQRKSIIPTRARSARLLRISLTGISARQLLCKNGLPMYLSSVFVGEVLSLSYTRHEHKRIISYDLSQSANMEQIQRMLAGALRSFPL